MKALIDVLNGRIPSRRPVWIMRQAGRYLPEYRELRARAGSFLGLCYDPVMASEVTLQPMRRFDLDAAIVFSDILVVPHAMGLSLDFMEGEGPRLSKVEGRDDVVGLADVAKSWQVAKVCETVNRVRQALRDDEALIGFCGAPWTVASYMVEGRSSDRALAIDLSVQRPEWFLELIDRLVQASIDFLVAQVAAGADVVQIFDSWAGDLSTGAREEFVLAPIRRIIQGLRLKFPGLPVIVFARGVGSYHGVVARETGASAVGVEEGIKLVDVLASLPESVAVQGNLSPQVLLNRREAIEAAVLDALDGVPSSRHIFNLGHGILQQTDPSHVTSLIETVRSFDRGA